MPAPDLLDRPEESTALARHGDQTSSLVLMFERLAKDPAVDVGKLEKLIEMQERILAHNAESAFNVAMAEAQKEMRPVAVDANNPQTKSRYASYEALDHALRPVYTRHGFALSFNTGDAPQPEYVRVLCTVTHISGHSKPYKADMPADGKGAKGGDVMTKTHAVGSAMSYGMRYLLKMIFNVATSEDDDDGNAASGKPTPPKPDGYELWADAIASVADNGLIEFEDAWKKSKSVYRNYRMQHEPQIHAMLKTKASKVRS